MISVSSLLRSICAALLLAVTLAGPPAQAKDITLRKEQIRAALLAGGPFAEGSYYECVNTNYRNGLTLAQIIEVCGIRMDDERLQGYGGDIIKETVSQAGGVDSFDPRQVQGACASGDPQLSQGNGDPRPKLSYHSAVSLADGKNSSGVPTLGDEPLHLTDPTTGKAVKTPAGEYVPLFGGYSSGGKGTVEKDANGVVLGSYKGLTEQESKALKEKAIAAYAAAKKKFDNGEISYSELQAAEAEAAKDPNFVPKGSSHTAEDSICEAVLTSARETLRECNRTGWKPAQCQQLHAKMNHCPDPTRIYVDPEAGYECGATIDAKLVIEAWVAGCRSVTTPGPDGSDPCGPPQINDGGQIARSDRDLCNNPQAYIDEEAAGCIGVLTVDNPVDQSISEIILYALDRFGGPTVVLPLRNPPPPGVGPEPMPGPK